MTITKLIASAFAALLFGGAAMAQTPAPAAAPKTTTAAPAKTETAPMTADKKAEKPRTASSIECSKEADAKGLHGKERHKFRSECKKNAGKS